MNRYPNLPGVALSVVLAGFAILLLHTSVARASAAITTVTRRSATASCDAIAARPRCAINAANTLRTFPRLSYSQSAPLAPAGTNFIVTVNGDGAACAPNTLTLRCAINEANTLGTFNSILFSSAVTQVMLSSTLPEITSQGTTIDGVLPQGGSVILNAAGIFNDNALVIRASDVLIFDVSIINTASNAADIQILGGRAVRIANSYLGIVPGAANCNFGGHTRSSGIGVDVATSAGDSGVGSAYIFGNVIGCHSSAGAGKGISIEASWAYVGQDLDGSIQPNDIGVEPGGSPVPNGTGVNLVSGGGVFTATNNSVLSNTIADNLGNGVELDGPVTSRNLVSGTVIYGNGHDGICENGDASDNVWTHVSIYHDSGLGLNTHGNCFAFFGPNEAVDAPFPAITSVDRATHLVRGTASPSASCPLFCVTVELYRAFPNPRGFGEGKTFVGATTTDSSGNWSFTDSAFAGGCYTAFETTFQFLLSGSHEYSSEFGPDNCRTWLPLIHR